MKTKIFGGIAIVAIAIAVAFNVALSNQKQDKASMLALTNVEVLAFGEGGYSCTVTTNCMSGSVSCTGVISCQRSPDWVKCDGHKTYC